MKIVDYVEVGKRIKSEREINGITREKFAELVGISATYLSQLELGQRHASLNTTIRIANILSLSLDYLIYGDSTIEIDRTELVELINKASNKDLVILKQILDAVLPFYTKKN